MDIKVLADNYRMKADTGLKHFHPLIHYECKSKRLKGDAHKRPLRYFFSTSGLLLAGSRLGDLGFPF